jgi:hypothetical protein
VTGGLLRASWPLPPVYRGRAATLATKHGKERAVAAPLRAGLGLEVVVPEGLDTDRLGTFTGEIERVGRPEEVALRKARMGMERTGSPLGLASEGSFGPYPHAPFVAGDHELLVFVDDELGIEVSEQALTFETNFGHRQVSSLEELGDFPQRARFPSHALVVRPAGSLVPADVRKGITSEAGLREAFAAAQERSESGVVHVETDMRAHVNPTRMRAIRSVAVKLARRLRERCPECAAPGWGVVAVEKGLPCSRCGSPTDFVRQEVFGCPRCDRRRPLPRRDGLAAANPQHCPLCNP